jgi:hypothetical protein
MRYVDQQVAGRVPPRESSATVDVIVEHRAPYIRFEFVDVPTDPPPTEHPCERLLHQITRCRRVTGQQEA